MADPNDTLDPEPVDAEFEMADEDSSASSRAPRGGIHLGQALVLFFFASLIGGGLGFAGARFFPAQSAATTQPSAETTALSQTVTGLETRLAALEAEDPEAAARALNAPLETRLTQLEAVPPGSVDLSGIEARLTALEVRPADAAPDMTRVTALEERAATIEQTQIDLDARLAQQALDSQAPASPAVDPAILANLSERLTALETARPSDTQPAAPPAEITALTNRIDALERDLAAARAIADDAQTTADNTAQSVANRPVDDGQAARQLAARALALTALRDQAATGTAFEAERAALARLWRGNADLAALASYSRAGAPSLDDLTENYPATQIRDAAGSGRHFFGLLQVRRVDPAEDESDPLALATLAETRLAEGDLEAAVLLTEQLSDAPLAAAQDWLLGARARLETETRLANLRQSLTADAAAQGADPS